MDVILHIGTNKTGTSSLQDFLMRNPGPLAEAGWVYPEAGRAGGAAHHPLAQMMRKAPDQLAGAVAACLAEAEGLRGIILSSEAFHDSPNKPALAAALAGHRVRVVVFLRDYLDYLSSWYREDVQTATVCCDFASYGQLKRKRYAPLLDKWAAAFGRAALEVRAYDRGALQNGSMIDEVLCAIMGIADLSGFQHSGWDNNPSVSGNLLFLKRLMNNFLSRQDSRALRPEIDELSKLDPAFRAPMEISEDLARLIYGFYLQDRDRIAQDYGTRLDFRPEGRRGAAVPDMARLQADYSLILGTAEARGYRICGPLRRYSPKLLQE